MQKCQKSAKGAEKDDKIAKEGTPKDSKSVKEDAKRGEKSAEKYAKGVKDAKSDKKRDKERC